MSGPTGGGHAAAAPRGNGWRRSVRRDGPASREAEGFQGFVRSPDRHAPARGVPDRHRRDAGRPERHLQRRRPEDPRQRDGHPVRGRGREAAAGQRHEATGGRCPPRGRAGKAGGPAREHARDARLRRGLHGAPERPAGRRRGLHPEPAFFRCRHDRRAASADRLPEPRRRRQVVALAAQLLRQPPVRRHVEPRSPNDRPANIATPPSAGR